MRSQTIFLVDLLPDGTMREAQQVGKYLYADDKLRIGQAEMIEQLHQQLVKERQDRQDPVGLLAALTGARERLVPPFWNVCCNI